MFQSTLSKTCSKCHEQKPLDCFNKQSRSKDGHHYYCRECQRAYVKANKERYADYSRQWHAENRERKAQLAREWNAKNGGTPRETSPEELARRAASNREWANQNPGRKAELQRRWKQSNPEVVREYHNRRRALIAQTTAEKVDPSVVWAESAGVCYLCQGGIDIALAYPDPLSKSLDHITPISRGGTHTFENLAYVHLTCNLAKNAKVVQKL